MQDSRLVLLLQTLDKKEQRELRKFVESPFFNQRKDLPLLLELLFERLNDGQAAPSKEEAFRHLYGKEAPFDDHAVRMAMSFLLKLAEQFLVHRDFFGDEVKVKTRLAELYRRRGLPKHFERSIREAQEAREATPWRNAESYRDDYHLQLTQYRFAASARRTAEHNLQAVTDQLDLAYFAQKLRQVCLQLSHEAVFQAGYRFGMLDEILAYTEANGLLEAPAIGTYYHCYRALTQPEQPAHFQQLKAALVREADKFPPPEIADLYLLAINFCIRRHNAGDASYLADEFDLYREGLKRGIFLNNGTLSRFTYRNAVTTGLKMQAYDWVGQFIHEFRDKLERQYRESMFSFNLARLEYERRRYAEALRLLQKSEYEDLLLNLAAKALLLKIFFETHEYDALASHLEAMRRFILRKKNVIGYHGEHYLNLVLFTKKLMETAGFEQGALAALRREVEGTKALAEKGWLLGAIL